MPPKKGGLKKAGLKKGGLRKKGKKGKRAKKKKESHRDLTSYEQEITEKNRQLARLRQENDQLETTISGLRAQAAETQEDREDIQAHLTRVIAQKNQEIEELNEKLVALEEKRKNDAEEFRKRLEIYKHEYRTMESSLGAEVKMAAGKLSALEDWRLARHDLMTKFEEQEKNMREQEERHRETLYHAEKTMIIEKSRMQEALKESLITLAASLSNLSSLQVSNTVHRTLRENVALSRTVAKALPLAVSLYANRKWGRPQEELELELARMENVILTRAEQKRKSEVDRLSADIHRLNAQRTSLLLERSRLANFEELHRSLFWKSKALMEEKEAIARELEGMKEKEKEMEATRIAKENVYTAMLKLKKKVTKCLEEALQAGEKDFDEELFRNKLTYCLCRLLRKENFCSDLVAPTDSIAELKLREI